MCKGERLGKLSIETRGSQPPHDLPGVECDIRPVKRRTGGWPSNRVPAFKITPIVNEPLLDVFRVAWGGGRMYGGGTSKEASRRQGKKRKNGSR